MKSKLVYSFKLKHAFFLFLPIQSSNLDVFSLKRFAIVTICIQRIPPARDKSYARRQEVIGSNVKSDNRSV